VSEVKRYGHIGYLVNASETLCELYPDMTVYVKASDYDAAQSELAALREELATAKRVGPPHFCGLPMSRNPHPEAGVPGRFLEVGTVRECIPCFVSSRHNWAKTAADLQQSLADAEQRNPDLLDICSSIQDDPRLWLMTSSDLSGKISAALTKPEEAKS